MTGPRILVVDNYDSFAYNLVQYVGEALQDGVEGSASGTDDQGTDDRIPPGGDVVVRRNDAITVRDVREIDPDGIVVSPGPGTPAAAGVSVPIFEKLSYPTLGVCLGHQALCVANGAAIVHADRVVHGKSSVVTHDGDGIFVGVSEPLEVGRYHSLAVARDALPGVLTETAHTVGMPGHSATETDHVGTKSDHTANEADVVMAVRHEEKPHVGVQFHPESILTEGGRRLVSNFCKRCSTT